MTYEEALAAYNNAEAGLLVAQAVYEGALVAYDKAEETFEDACLARFSGDQGN